MSRSNANPPFSGVIKNDIKLIQLARASAEMPKDTQACAVLEELLHMLCRELEETEKVQPHHIC